MGFTRGSLTLPRMNAHRLVIIAAALTTMMAAALASALATFGGQTLPRAVRDDLGRAAGTSIAISGSVTAGQAARYDAILPGRLSSALHGTPFAFYRARWSDPFGFVPGSPPAPPSGGALSASTGNVQLAEAAALDGIAGQAVLVSGHWPGTAASGQPIPAALPATAAALLHVTDGEMLRMRDRISGRLVRFVVTGQYRPRHVSSPYWDLSEIPPSGSSTVSGFTAYGPLVVPASAFAGPLTVDGGSWLALPHTASIPGDRLTAVAASVTGLQQSLQQAQGLPNLTLVTGLPAVLDGIASNLDLARSLLAICAVLLFLLAGAALLAVARLLAGQREGESAMLTARGATRWQLVRLTAAEAVPLCVLAAAAGGAAGVLLARLLAVAGASALVIMLVPVLGTVTPGTARVRRGRQAAISGVTRAGADLALVLLAVLAGWQLRHYSAVSPGANGSYGVDPVIVAAPALALAGGTVLALRLLPAGGKAGDRLAARGRRLAAALASWQISRQPIRQGGAALLIVLAVGTAALALSQRQSWTRSGQDQAAFGVGADVRVQASEPLSAAQAGALARTPGVRAAMPVARFPQEAIGGEVLALGAGQAAGIANLRADQAPRPAAALFGTITPAGPPPGAALPGRPTAVRLTARLGPASLGLSAFTVSLSVEDADSDVYQLSLGSLPADGRDHTLAAGLGNRAIYPLRLAAISLAYTMPAKPAPGGTAVLALDGFAGPAGSWSGPLPGTALRSWPARGSSSELMIARQTGGTAGPSALPAVLGPSVGRGTTLTVAFRPGYGQAAGRAGAPPSPVQGQLALAPAAPAVIPALATRAYLAATHASAGSTVQASIDGAAVSMKIVAVTATFPTVTGSGGALVADLGTLQHVLNADSLEPARPAQWWLATSAPAAAVLPGLAASLPPGSAVTSTADMAAGLLDNPLSSVPQDALLAVALAAAVLAITGFCVSIAADTRLRRAENALLAALGVPPRAAAGQLCLEKCMLSAPAALAGLVLGVVLAELLVPAITLSPAATAPVPPVLLEFGWSQTLPLALAVAVLPVLAAALTVARRPDAAAALRASEAT
jgi:hypothetical protein